MLLVFLLFIFYSFICFPKEINNYQDIDKTNKPPNPKKDIGEES